MSGEASAATPASAVLAFELLYDRVGARYASEGRGPAQVEQVFGLREPPRQLGELPRIVWMPGDAAGNLGELKPPRWPGRNPRPLATIDELFTVILSAWDRTAPDNERAQYRAVRLLLDEWHRHVQRVCWAWADEGSAPEGFGGIRILSQRWERAQGRNEGSLGAAVRVTGAIPAMVPDELLATAPADTTAEITTELLDVSEIDEIPESP